MRPNFDPRRIKIDVKNEGKKTMLLKIVLEPSWVDLGAPWVPSWGHLWWLFIGFINGFENHNFHEKLGLKRRLGSIWGRFGFDLGRLRGSKMRSAEGLKRREVE